MLYISYKQHSTLLSPEPSAAPWCFQTLLGAGCVLANVATATIALGPKLHQTFRLAAMEPDLAASQGGHRNGLAQSSNSGFPPTFLNSTMTQD